MIKGKEPRGKILPEWTKLPTGWIQNYGLKEFRWAGGNGSDYQASLMAFTVLLNHAALDTGITRLTYDELCMMTSLSRAKLASGLDLLASFNLIEREPEGRSSYRISDHETKSGWAKFPARGLYARGCIAASTNFRLRQRAELDALKLYFLIASRREPNSNMALISYEKIEEYSGVTREHIRRA